MDDQLRKRYCEMISLKSDFENLKNPLDSFLKELDSQNVGGRERHNAIRNFKEQDVKAKDYFKLFNKLNSSRLAFNELYFRIVEEAYRKFFIELKIDSQLVKSDVCDLNFDMETNGFTCCGIAFEIKDGPIKKLFGDRVIDEVPYRSFLLHAESPTDEISFYIYNLSQAKDGKKDYFEHWTLLEEYENISDSVLHVLKKLLNEYANLNLRL